MRIPLSSIGLSAVLVLLVACADVSPLAPAERMPARASTTATVPCVAVLLEGITRLEDPKSGIFEGEGTLSVDGTIRDRLEVRTMLLESIRQGSGAQVLRTSHRFSSGKSFFITEDLARLVPTDRPGVFRLNSTLSIIEAEGRYSDAESPPAPPLRTELSSTIDLIRGIADWTIRGDLCGTSL